MVAAKAFENRHLLDRVPDYYERLKSSYDARFYQQEVLGEYLHLHAGRVYYGFEREKNVGEVKVDRKRALLWALDFNVDPMCSVVAQVEGDGVLVLDEIVLSRATTQQACEEFQNRFPEHGAGLKVYADASGAHMQTTGTSDLAVLKKFFRSGEYGAVEFKVPRSNPAVRDRVMVVNVAFQRMKIDSRCKELIKDLEQVAYKENTQVIDKDRDPKRTHLSDALGYLVWQELRVGEKVGERGEVDLMAFDIDQEHPEYAARKAAWRKYRDLYAGGEQFKANAAEYLIRRQREPGDVYSERLSRVFYENYVGSIVDWYAATLFRREPVITFEGNDGGVEDVLRGAGGGRTDEGRRWRISSGGSSPRVW